MQGYTTSDYSPKLAAQSYLQHGAGVSKRASKYLEKIVAGELSNNLTLFIIHEKPIHLSSYS